MLLAAGLKTQAQFNLSAGPCIGYNGASFFGDFRNYYNQVNRSELKKKMGSPSLLYGYSALLSYHILKMSSSLGRQQLYAQTHAGFGNGAKRIIQYNYKITTIDVGYFHPGELTQFAVEIGMVHLLTDQYSFVKLPNKEIDRFAGGISGTNHWVNIGLNLHFLWTKSLSDAIRIHFEANGIFVNNDDAPYALELAGNKATLSLNGITASTGITLILGDYID